MAKAIKIAAFAFLWIIYIKSARCAAFYDDEVNLVNPGLEDPYDLFSFPLLNSTSATALVDNGSFDAGGSGLLDNTKRTERVKRGSATDSGPAKIKPTPEPTGKPSPATTVHITSQNDFSLLLPNRPGEKISDAESDGVAFCTPSSKDGPCGLRMQEGFIRAAAIKHADDGSWVQVTGCIDLSKSQLDHSDDGGQLDVRFPNGAQCTFGGYGASFIEQVEPSASRFCLRCCASHNDQVHCNSYQDQSGCLIAVPGQYTFPELGVDCS